MQGFCAILYVFDSFNLKKKKCGESLVEKVRENMLYFKDN